MTTMSMSHKVHDLGLLLLRVAVGGFMLPHGLGKLFGWLGGPGIAGFAAELQGFGLPSGHPLPLFLALVQTLSGLAVAIGAWTRWSALLAAAFLATTVWVGVPSGWFWMHDGIEYPLLWTATLVAIVLLGAGSLSMDAWIAARRASRRAFQRAVPLTRPVQPRFVAPTRRPVTKQEKYHG